MRKNHDNLQYGDGVIHDGKYAVVGGYEKGKTWITYLKDGIMKLVRVDEVEPVRKDNK